MNSDLMAQIHAKALKASLAEAACSSDAGTSNGTPLPSEAPENDEKAVDESAPDLKAFKNRLAGLFGGPSPMAPEFRVQSLFEPNTANRPG